MIHSDKTEFLDFHVKVHLGNQMLKKKSAMPSRNMIPFWNEELFFVAVEPFEDILILMVKDRLGPSKEEIRGGVSRGFLGFPTKTTTVLSLLWS